MTVLERRSVLGLAIAGLALPETAKSAEVAALPLVHALSVRIELSPPVEQGRIDGKRKRFVPITGGTFEGPRLRGIVLPGGGDWQAIHDDGLTEIFARYSLRTDDGVTIGITNPGVRVAAPEIIRRLANGENVPPDQYYFRTTPSFDVADGAYGWLRRRIFVARGIRKPDHVLMDIFDVG